MHIYKNLIDLINFVTHIERSLISHINTIKFPHVTDAIPLQEFGQNETLLATLANIMLHYKAKVSGPSCNGHHNNVIFFRKFYLQYTKTRCHLTRESTRLGAVERVS